jgi:hypothetical protein
MGCVAGTSRTVIDLVTGPSCSLAGWSGRPGRCRWCDGAAQVGTRWCGTVCEDAYRNNHDWASARQAVLTRDRDRCVMCGTGPDTVAIARLLIRALIPLGPVEAARLWHSSDWWAFELACSVEVVRVSGGSGDYRLGCHQHMDSLETRCRQHQDAEVISLTTFEAG